MFVKVEVMEKELLFGGFPLPLLAAGSGGGGILNENCIISVRCLAIPVPHQVRDKLQRESRKTPSTGFLLEFIPMKIGAGMTKMLRV
jgi:hypothetical protein